MCYLLFFGFLSMTLTGVAYALLYEFTGWHPYLTWLVSINGVTLLMYGIDSVIGKQGQVEAPETVMHLLSAGGGFVGTWLGRALFGYKVDMKGNPWVYIVLVVSTVGHAVLAYNWLIVGQ